MNQNEMVVFDRPTFFDVDTFESVALGLAFFLEWKLGISPEAEGLTDDVDWWSSLTQEMCAAILCLPSFPEQEGKQFDEWLYTSGALENALKANTAFLDECVVLGEGVAKGLTLVGRGGATYLCFLIKHFRSDEMLTDFLQTVEAYKNGKTLTSTQRNPVDYLATSLLVEIDDHHFVPLDGGDPLTAVESSALGMMSLLDLFLGNKSVTLYNPKNN